MSVGETYHPAPVSPRPCRKIKLQGQVNLASRYRQKPVNAYVAVWRVAAGTTTAAAVVMAERVLLAVVGDVEEKEGGTSNGIIMPMFEEGFPPES